jgi:hypothetical protein
MCRDVDEISTNSNGTFAFMNVIGTIGQIFAGNSHGFACLWLTSTL